jgi:2-keto-4-pentenoate hydratase/2-oxohepta-3-ene-1,7-dioic acid hydratase in catechol pathway
MRLIAFDDEQIGVVVESSVIDVTSVVSSTEASWPPVRMLQTIRDFEVLRPRIEQFLASAPAAARRPLGSIAPAAPVPWPNKLVAFPANYQLHIDEMKSINRANHNGFFLKSNASLVGARDKIVRPDVGTSQIHHECELGLIIGREGRDISIDRALEYIFGYTCLMDITLRGPQERVARKSFDTFTPTGPWITTADEIADPADLDLELSVNGEVRQRANTRDLLLSIPEMIAMTSAVTTLYPGDIIATGTPEGVGPIEVGDVVTISIPAVGAMSLPVVAAPTASGFDIRSWAERKVRQ